MCENGETNVSLTESAATHELGNIIADNIFHSAVPRFRLHIPTTKGKG